MKNVLAGLLAILSVVFGVYAYNNPKVQVQEEYKTVEVPVGAAGNQFSNGVAASKYFGINSVSASTTTTTVTSAVSLRDGAFGQITIGTGTPATNLFRASSTAITAKSMVFVEQTSNSSLAGVTCNTTPTSTPIIATVSSSTNASLNGFTLTAVGIPATNPLCYNYWIFDRD